MDLGTKIKTLRIKQGFTQEQLAELVGVTRQAEAKWETGATAPDVYKVTPLAKALGVSVESLLDPSEHVGEARPVAGPAGPLSNKITVKVLDYEVAAVSDFLGALGYQACFNAQEEGQLLILDPTTFFASNKTPSFLNLSFALPVNELTDSKKAALREELIYGPKVQTAFEAALAARAKMEGARHLGRGIVYLVFSVLDFALIIIDTLLIPQSLYFLLGYLLVIPLFVILLVFGIKWVKPVQKENFPAENAAYSQALSVLCSAALTNRNLRAEASLLNR